VVLLGFRSLGQMCGSFRIQIVRAIIVIENPKMSITVKYWVK